MTEGFDRYCWRFGRPRGVLKWEMMIYILVDSIAANLVSHFIGTAMRVKQLRCTGVT